MAFTLLQAFKRTGSPWSHLVLLVTITFGALLVVVAGKTSKKPHSAHTVAGKNVSEPVYEPSLSPHNPLWWNDCIENARENMSEKAGTGELLRCCGNIIICECLKSGCHIGYPDKEKRCKLVQKHTCQDRGCQKTGLNNYTVESCNALPPAPWLVLNSWIWWVLAACLISLLVCLYICLVWCKRYDLTNRKYDDKASKAKGGAIRRNRSKISKRGSRMSRRSNRSRRSLASRSRRPPSRRSIGRTQRRTSSVNGPMALTRSRRPTLTTTKRSRYRAASMGRSGGGSRSFTSQKIPATRALGIHPPSKLSSGRNNLPKTSFLRKMCA